MTIMLNEGGNWKEQFMEFAPLYEREFISRNTISPELHMWETFWTKTYRGDIPSSLTETLKVVGPMNSSFPNIYAALQHKPPCNNAGDIM